jgi:hypothetical protein
MSADNGVYILKSRAPMVKSDDGWGWVHPPHGHEYRVAHCCAIDNLDYSDLYLPLYFGRSKVYIDQKEAVKEAERIYDEIMESDFPIVEYGISFVESDKEYPRMTVEQAEDAVDREDYSWQDYFIQGLHVLKHSPKMKIIDHDDFIEVDIDTDLSRANNNPSMEAWKKHSVEGSVRWVLYKNDPS